ncbi:MAG: hypothetical protein JXC85_03420 [Candidatus Aenigmarchaeota archaeon]|nr:hypothetical protein [Candidatus Aenigmarchaeota archaeon]
MAKLQETKDGNYFVYVPKLKVMRKKWKKGQLLDWSFDQDGNLVLIDVDNEAKNHS